ncbi:MAG: S1 RNA-binding domain-containing protein [Anaerolineaceae bacterium]|nr:MAG: S1 RNA-binding domain-containing protein [Anaerolineaceae bacterium]
MTEPNEEVTGNDAVPSTPDSGEYKELDTHPMDVLLDSDSYELEMPRRGELRKGTIARVTETDILVDVGAKSEGVIPARELEKLSRERREELTIGQEVDVYVLRSGGRDGALLLSIVRAEEENDWREAERLLADQNLYEGIISGFNKGGLIIKVGRLRGFVPASQVSLSRRRRAHGSSPDQRWGKMVGEPIMTKVIEVDRRRNRLIMSERAAAREARDILKERLIDELQPGEIRTGHVISLADFGAFIDIGGADGLVHMSEISWKRIAHPRDLLKVGQKVEVKVLGIDPSRKRISLSLRELEADPWESILGHYREGQLIEGTITKLTRFGAFATLVGTEEYDIEGLIHISELSDKRIEHPREVVQEGQELTLRVIKLDRDRRRIGLSLKRVDSVEYAEQDLQAAMQEIDTLEEEGISVSLPEDVEDFDAALEAEAQGMDEPELMVEEAQAEELEVEAEEALAPEAQIEDVAADEETPSLIVEEPEEIEEVVEIDTEELESLEPPALEEPLLEEEIDEVAEMLEEETIVEVDATDLETREEEIVETVEQDLEVEQVDEAVDEVETVEDVAEDMSQETGDEPQAEEDVELSAQISEDTELDEQETIPEVAVLEEGNPEAETSLEGAVEGEPLVDEEAVGEADDDQDESK